jgi:hypothetical protein
VTRRDELCRWPPWPLLPALCHSRCICIALRRRSPRQSAPTADLEAAGRKWWGTGGRGQGQGGLHMRAELLADLPSFYAQY